MAWEQSIYNIGDHFILAIYPAPVPDIDKGGEDDKSAGLLWHVWKL